MLDRLRESISFRLKAMPSVFAPVASLREDSKKTVVRRNSDVVIEGFWRCGNHYATYAFISAQTQPVRVAHHFHAPAQLLLACRWGVPAILLIRAPVDAVASSTIYLKHDDPRPFLRSYNLFHQCLLPIRDRIVVSDFDETVGDFGGVIRRLNRHYGRDFQLFHESPESRRRVAEMIHREHESRMGADAGTLPLPSEEKARRKQDVVDRINSPACRALLAEANRNYEILSETARRQRAESPTPDESVS